MSCTTLLVGKNASYDGSTLVARNDDSGGGRYDPKRFVAVSPADQPRHYRSVISHVEMDLPDDPCAYTIAPNALRNRGILAEAGISERNVAMSATETIAVNERVLGADPLVVLRPARVRAQQAVKKVDGLVTDHVPSAVEVFWNAHGEPEAYDPDALDTGLSVDDLFDEVTKEVGGDVGNGTIPGGDRCAASRDDQWDIPSDTEAHGEVPGGIGEEDIITLVLPYVHTAREAVRRLGELLRVYGTYEANGVSISDGDEVWYVETVGGHHWIARRVPDDCYAVIPNQLGIDDFDLVAALADGEGQGNEGDYMCSADLREFIETNHLDRSMDESQDHWRHLNPRQVFGTATVTDHVYNTPRAWYMERCLNPSDDWDSPTASHTPLSDDIPWCRVPEGKVSVEDVHRVLSSHYEDTPYDPYGHEGTEESRHRFRPVGISRTGHLAIMQIRPYMPYSFRSVMWLAFGSQPFTAPMPFYTSVSDTPAYLRDTTGEVDTHTLYWTARLIAVIADAQYDLNVSAVEAFHEDVMGHGHAFLDQSDARGTELFRRALIGGAESSVDADDDVRAVAVETTSADGSVGWLSAPCPPAACKALHALLERANQRMADYLERRNRRLLSRVLDTSSDHMKNSFALSDRPH